MGPTTVPGGEYDTVGFRELRKDLEGHKHGRSQTPGIMPNYWHKQNKMGFFEAQKEWNPSPKNRMRSEMRDGRMHYTKASYKAAKVNPRDPTVPSTYKSKIGPIMIKNFMNGRDKCVPGEEGRLSLQGIWLQGEDPKGENLTHALREQCKVIKPKGHQWTEGMFAYINDTGAGQVETIEQHRACCIPLYSSFNVSKVFDPFVWQPTRMHDQIRQHQMSYTLAPDPEDALRAARKRGSVVGDAGSEATGSMAGTGSVASRLSDRAKTAPNGPPEGKIGRRGSLSFKIVDGSGESPGTDPVEDKLDAMSSIDSLMRPLRSQTPAGTSQAGSPYVLRARLNSSPSPPKSKGRRAIADALPRIGKVITGGELTEDGHFRVCSPLGAKSHMFSPGSFSPTNSPADSGRWSRNSRRSDAWGADSPELVGGGGMRKMAADPHSWEANDRT